MIRLDKASTSALYQVAPSLAEHILKAPLASPATDRSGLYEHDADCNVPRRCCQCSVRAKSRQRLRLSVSSCSRACDLQDQHGNRRRWIAITREGPTEGSSTLMSARWVSLPLTWVLQLRCSK